MGIEVLLAALTPVLIKAVLPVAGTVASALISYAAFEFKRYLSKKTKMDAANDAISHIEKTAITVVRDIEQSLMPAYERMSATGKLTDEFRTALKNIAIKRVKEQIPVELEALAKYAVKNIDDLIKNKIEGAVLDLKK